MSLSTTSSIENNNFNLFFEEKLKNFCDLVNSKNNKDMNRNIEGLKFIYNTGYLKFFIDNLIIPLKDKIIKKDCEVLSLIYPKEKIHEIVNLFSEEEKEKIFKFIEMLLELKDLF